MLGIDMVDDSLHQLIVDDVLIHHGQIPSRRFAEMLVQFMREVWVGCCRISCIISPAFLSATSHKLDKADPDCQHGVGQGFANRLHQCCRLSSRKNQTTRYLNKGKVAG